MFITPCYLKMPTELKMLFTGSRSVGLCLAKGSISKRRFTFTFPRGNCPSYVDHLAFIYLDDSLCCSISNKVCVVSNSALSFGSACVMLLTLAVQSSLPVDFAAYTT